MRSMTVFNYLLEATVIGSVIILLVIAVRALLRECMEGVMELSVPLRIDLSVGRNWRECK